MYVDGEVLNFRMSYKAKLLPNIEVASVVIDEAGKGTLISSGGEVNGAPLEFGGTLSIHLVWRWVCWGIS